MPSVLGEKQPLHVKLVDGRWYRDPPDRLRKGHGLKTQPLGPNKEEALAYARILNRDHLTIAQGKPVPGTVAALVEAFLDSERCSELSPSTQKDYR